MGQYFKPVNLDKNEYLDPFSFPHCDAKLGEGWDEIATALYTLLARGFSDEDGWTRNDVLGRWAGDRIVIIGDYDDSGLYCELGGPDYQNISWLVSDYFERRAAVSRDPSLPSLDALLEQAPARTQEATVCSALYIETEGGTADYKLFVDGEALYHSLELEALAAQVKVRPLAEFLSIGTQEALAYTVSADSYRRATNLPQEVWYDAEEGLLTVRALLQLLTSGQVPAPANAPFLIVDLQEFETALTHLQTEGIRWHLVMDY